MRRVVLAVTLALCAWLAPERLGGAWSCPRRAATASARSATGTLDQVVLPTAHNAMSAASLGWTFPNQPVGIPQQLAYGVRGFLWDTHYGHVGRAARSSPTPELPESKLYLCHEACQLGATPLVEVLQAIRIFLHFHPRNVIVIVNEDYVSPTDYAQEFTARRAAASTCTAAARAPGRRCGR